MTNAETATVTLCSIYGANLLLLLIWRPFNNGYLQFSEVAMVTASLGSLILMRFGAGEDNDTTQHDLLYAGYLLLQFVAIFLVTIPIWLDLFITIFFKLLHKMCKGSKRETEEDEEAAREEAEVKRLRARVSFWTFLHYYDVMLRHNAAAMLSSLQHQFRSTHEGPTKEETGTQALLRRGSSVIAEDASKDRGSFRSGGQRPALDMAPQRRNQSHISIGEAVSPSH